MCHGRGYNTFSMVRGWLDMVVPGVRAIKLVIRLDLGQPKVVLSEC